jgi:predicted transcriptional regulator
MAKLNDGESIVSNQFIEINEDTTLGKALSLFEKSTDILIVTNKKKEYSGVLPEHSILRTDLDPSKSKVKSIKISAPKVNNKTGIEKCAKLMVENKILYLPFFENNKIVGVVSYLDLLKSPNLQKLSKYTVKNIMSRTMFVTSPNEKIGVIYNRFRKSNIFSMPVVEDGKFSGMIYLHDTLHTIIQHKEKPDYRTKFGEKQHLMDLPIRNIITKTATIAHESDTLGEVIEKIIENKLDCISVIDDQEQLQALITVRDLLKLVTTEDTLFIRPKITINSNISNIDRNRVNDSITEFVTKFGNVLSQSEVEIYMREHKEKHKDQKLIYTRLQLHAHHDKYEATGEGWGYEHSLKEVLSKIEKQIKKKKTSKKHIRKR